MDGLTQTHRRTRLFALSLALLAVVLVGGAMLWRSDHGRVPEAEQPTAEASLAGADGAALNADTLTSGTPSDGATRSSSPTRLRIVSRGGTPIENVRGTWTPLDRDWLERTASWPALDWKQLDQQTRMFISDANGEMALDGLPGGEERSALWLSHEEYVATCIELGSLLVIPGEVTLQPSDGLSAVVMGSDGKFAQGATVVTMPNLSRDDAHVEGDDRRQCDSVFRSVTQTDVAGTAALVPLPSEQFVYAELDGRKSEPWIGTAPAKVALQLQSTFTVGGRVELGSGARISSDLRVKCSARRGTTETVLDRAVVRSDGTWGSVELPLVACDSYAFRLRGGSIAEDQVFKDPPQPGGSLVVDFHPSAGIALSILVTDQAGVALQDAMVSVHWTIDGVWSSTVTKSGADGIAKLKNCRPGTIWIRVRKTGFALKVVDEMVVTEPPAEPIRVSLDRAGSIVGRCVHSNEPVRDFKILFWREGLNTHDELVVKDSVDGSFRIEEAPLGNVVLVATSNEFPRAKSLVAHVVPEQAADVTLEFPDVLPGTGRVVDGLTGEPIEDASIQVQVLYPPARVKVGPWRTAEHVDRNGVFTIHGFVEGQNEIEVSAPGYASRAAIRFASAQHPLDFGVIALFAKQALRIRLLSDTPEDYSGYTANLQGGEYYPDRTFSTSGTVDFEGLSTDSYSLRIIYPDKSVRDELVKIEPGRDTELNVALHTNQIAIEVVPDIGTESLPWYILTLTFANQDSPASARSFVVMPRVPIQVDGIVGKKLIVTVRDAVEAKVLALQDVSLEPTWPSLVQIKVNARPITIRVVDSSRNVIPRTRVILTSSARSGWNEQFVTDSNGECVVKGLDLQSVRVTLYHPDHGMRPSTHLEGYRAGAQSVELVLAPKDKLRIAAFERGAPVVGLEVSAMDGQDIGWGLGLANTNDDGIATWGPLEAGDIHIRVRHPGYWPTDERFQFTGERDPVPIQVRRLGSVDITVKNAYGNPAANVAVDLYSVEQNQWISEWVRSGLVVGSSALLRTGDDGRLRIHGLPNGEFRWRATSSDGDSAEGTVGVPALGTAQLEVRAQ